VATHEWQYECVATHEWHYDCVWIHMSGSMIVYGYI
jgi:hypothetical protein